MKIISSAVVHCGKVYEGHRHNNAIENAVEKTGIFPVKGCQGFILEDGTFVDRWTAMFYAKKSGQVPEDKKSEFLFSEDLW